MLTDQTATGRHIKLANMAESLLTKRLKNGRCKFDEFGTLEKFCSRCKEYWPADTEFFYATSSSSDGLHNWCMACYLENRYPDTRGAVGHRYGVHKAKGDQHA